MFLSLQYFLWLSVNRSLRSQHPWRCNSCLAVFSMCERAPSRALRKSAALVLVLTHIDCLFCFCWDVCTCLESALLCSEIMPCLLGDKNPPRFRTLSCVVVYCSIKHLSCVFCFVLGFILSDCT